VSKRNVRKQTQSRKQVLHGIFAELRSILRQRNNLRRPINKFTPAPPLEDGKPRFYVMFDNTPPRRISGPKLQTEMIQLPDERIQDAVLNLAQSVWHLKDRLNIVIRTKNKSVSVDSVINNNIELQVCADLANSKKHGALGTRSGLFPKLGLVTFDMSKSGVLEFFYKGDAKQKVLIVSNPVPIPYHVDIISDNGNKTLGNSVNYIWEAFKHWWPLISDLDILSSCAEGKFLKTQLF